MIHGLYGLPMLLHGDTKKCSKTIQQMRLFGTLNESYLDNMIFLATIKRRYEFKYVTKVIFG